MTILLSIGKEIVMNLTSIITLIAVLLATLAMGACTHRRHSHADYDDKRALKHLTKKLELNSTQQVEVQKILREVNSLKTTGDVIRQDLQTRSLQQLQAAEVETAEDTAFQQQQLARLSSLAESFSAAIARLKRVLTPEQRQKLVTELKKHDRHGKKKHSRH